MKPTPFNVLAALIGLKHTCQKLVKGYAIDSRLIKEGELFFALKGERVDGHDYLEEVAAKGAVGAVICESYRGETFGLAVMHVPDVLEYLQEMARRVQEKRQSKVVGITGSIGKTTTKGFIKTLLEGTYKVFASPLSYNSQATVPLSLLMADGSEDYLLIEMGMTEQGQIKRLVSIAPPDIAVLTAVAVQQVDHFPDGLAAIAREKGAIFAHPKTQMGIVHRDLHHFEEVAQIGGCKKRTFSLRDQKADYYLEERKGGIRVHVEGDRAYDLKVYLPIKAHYQNVLAAVGVALAAEVPWSVIEEMAPQMTLPPMRFERVEKGGIIFINDAYNANPDSMQAAMESLPEPEDGGKKVAFLGDMNALGMYTEAGHLAVAEVALENVDYLICIGEHGKMMEKVWREHGRPVEWFVDRKEAEQRLLEVVNEGDVVLLKGSRVHALEKVLECF